MPNKPQSIPEALATLEDLQARLRLYGIGEPNESADVPGAIVVDSARLNALKLLVEVAVLTAAGSWRYIAISGYGWGCSPSPIKAVQKCKESAPRGKKSQIKLYRAHPDTEMFGDGSWTYPQGFPPVQVTI